MVVADVGFVHQLRQPRSPDVVGGRLRDARPIEDPVDPLAREMPDRTEPGDLGDDGVEQRSGVDRRRDGHGQRGGAARPPGLGPQARDHAAGDVQHECRRSDHQLLEHVGGQRGERGVAHGTNRRRPRSIIEQPELADDVATAEFGDAPTVTLGPSTGGRITLRRGRIAESNGVGLHRDHQAATDDEVGRVGLVALLEQQIAGLEPPPADAFHDLLDEPRVPRPEEVGDHRRDLRAVDPLARLRRHRIGDIGMFVEPLLEVGPPDHLHLGRSGCRERRRPPAAGDHRDLADHLPFPDPADGHVAVGAAGRRDELTGRDDVDVIGLIALAHQHLTVDEADTTNGHVEVPQLWRLEFHPSTPPSSTRRGVPATVARTGQVIAAGASMPAGRAARIWWWQ